jgi:hypothetical protein
MTAGVIVAQVVVPLLFITWLVRPPLPDPEATCPPLSDPEATWKSRSNWLLHVVVTAGVLAYAWTVGAQSWTSVYLGAGLVVLFAVALVHSARNLPAKWTPFRFGDAWPEKLFVGAQLVMGLFFVPASLYALSGYTFEGKPVDLRFPLDDGVYIAGHGGSNPLINYHNTSESQQYAVDLLRLNAFGTRALGWYPDELDRYAIYGDTLRSPCTGEVREVVSDHPEYAPPKRGDRHPAGNHVVLRCKGVRVHLAHLIPGSAAVDSGRVVQAGAPVGRVGNSGNSSEPHLHVHATRDGRGVPITFAGRFLVRNSLVWR